MENNHKPLIRQPGGKSHLRNVAAELFHAVDPGVVNDQTVDGMIQGASPSIC